MLKKFAIWFWPILRQVLLMTLEKQIQETLYGRPKTRKYVPQYPSSVRPTRNSGLEMTFGEKRKPLKPRFDYPLAIFENEKGECDELLARLLDEIHKYNVATVADFMELTEYPKAPTYSDTQWGWRDLSDCEVLIDPLQPDMWSLTLPRPIYLGPR